MLVHLFVELLRDLLLLFRLVADSRNLALYLQDLVILNFDEVSHGIKGLISLLHAKESLLPVFKQRLLAHLDPIDLNVGLLQRVQGGCSLLLLRDKLSLIESLLLVKTLNFLVH